MKQAELLFLWVSCWLASPFLSQEASLIFLCPVGTEQCKHAFFWVILWAHGNRVKVTMSCLGQHPNLLWLLNAVIKCSDQAGSSYSYHLVVHGPHILFIQILALLTKSHIKKLDL